MRLFNKFWQTTLVIVVAGAFACGCGDDDDLEELYFLSSAVADPVPVSLDGDLGVLTFTLTSNPIPTEPSATLLGYLTGGTIALNVANDETGVNYNLVQGVQVTGTPAAPGEYSVVDSSASGDGTELTIAFYNEFNDSTISAGGDYTATVSVLDNQYFVVEEFMRDVTVTEL